MNAAKPPTFPTSLPLVCAGVLIRDGVKAESWEDLNRPDIKIGVTLGSSPDLILTKNIQSAAGALYQYG
jgi:hypothetical protein